MISASEIYLALGKHIRSVVDVPLVVRSVPQESKEQWDDWVAYELLSIVDSPARTHTVDRVVTIQIIIYSRHTEKRRDNKLTANLELADTIYTAVNRRNVPLKDSCIQLKDAKMVTMDLRSIGDFAKGIYQQSPSLDLQSTVLLIDGIISTHTLPPGV